MGRKCSLPLLAELAFLPSPMARRAHGHGQVVRTKVCVSCARPWGGRAHGIFSLSILAHSRLAQRIHDGRHLCWGPCPRLLCISQFPKAHFEPRVSAYPVSQPVPGRGGCQMGVVALRQLGAPVGAYAEVVVPLVHISRVIVECEVKKKYRDSQTF